MPRKKKAAEDPGYYSYKRIMDIDAVYRLIIGQRSNGKTFGWCKMVLDNFFCYGLPSVYFRRLDEMIKPKIIQDLFAPHEKYIEEQTDGEYNSIIYRANAWYMCRKEADKAGNAEIVCKQEKPFCYSAAISTVETTKGVDHGEIWSIGFDEFITRSYYLQNEFVMFQNLVSSWVRDRPGVQIFMLANTVSKFCPYFKEMGLRHVMKQEPGTIDIYEIGKSGNSIAVEICAESEAVKKKVSKYFAFDNPQLEMITSGAWEMALYRHAPPELSQYPIMLRFFVEIEERLIQGNVYKYQGYPIIFFHPKTSEIEKPQKEIIYRNDFFDGNPLHQRDVKTCFCRAQSIIYDLIRTQKTFYADNDTGEAVAAWLRPQRLAAR